LSDGENIITSEAGRPGYDRPMKKDEINQLPLGRYQGPVHVLRDWSEADGAIEQLMAAPVLGFDIEIRPVFRRGDSHPPALLQLATNDAVYIFQLRGLDFPGPLAEVLARSKPIKAGVAPKHDLVKLAELGAFTAGGFIDLADMAAERGIKNYGLRGLTSVLLGFRISKQSQVTNWAKKNLSDAQITYAATDAWASLEIYRKLKAMPVLEEAPLPSSKA